jgi:predicted amidohydrolase YtcJ
MSLQADWIFTDLTLWSGGPEPAPDTPSPTSTGNAALALKDGCVLALGDPDRVLEHRGSDTAVVSLGGRFVMPGLVDAHVHLLTAGVRMFRVDLRGVRSRQEFVQRIADRTRITPPGRWILGGDWNQEEWGGAFPSRAWLDAHTPDHPVFLQRVDLHLGVANSRALELAGIAAETPDPVNGRIDRDPETGEPTGILRERAMLPVYDVIPELTDEDCVAALRGSALEALRHGITQVHDMGAVQKLSESWQALRVLRSLDAQGRLPLRVTSALPIRHWRSAAELVRTEGRGSGRVRWGPVKAFIDGSFGSSTAWFHEPYLHDPGSHGGPVVDLEELREQITGAVAAGLQPTIHSIGDRANDWLVELMGTLDREYPEAASRIRIEHAQHLSEEALEEIGRSERIVSVQPSHILDDAPWIPMRLGSERGRRSYAFRSLAEGGARLALGTDWPVAPLDPITTIWCAVTRRLPEGPGEGGGGVWNPQERMELDAVLRAHTWGGAIAAGTEDHTGSLEPGKAADFIVLSSNPFEMDPERFPYELRVDLTYVDGVLAYRRDDSGE